MMKLHVENVPSSFTLPFTCLIFTHFSSSRRDCRPAASITTLVSFSLLNMLFIHREVCYPPSQFWHVSISSFYYLWGQPFQNHENSVIHSGWTRSYHDVSIILACPINRTNVRCMLTTCIIMHHQDFFGPIKDKIENIFHKMDIHPSLHPGNLT